MSSKVLIFLLDGNFIVKGATDDQEPEVYKFLEDGSPGTTIPLEKVTVIDHLRIYREIRPRGFAHLSRAARAH
jgi:hypothetical protein